MVCPLCKQEIQDSDFIAHPYFQDTALKLACKMNPEWQVGQGCCTACFDAVSETADKAWVPTNEFPIKGVAEGFRYVLTKRETKYWNHINPHLQRWWQMNIVEKVAETAVGAGYDEWFLFDSGEKVLAQGRVTDAQDTP